MRIISHIAAFLLFAGASNAQTKDIQLYTLDCGTINVADAAAFDRENRLNGKSFELKVPCYLIRHPKGDLLWDVGLNEALAASPEGIGAGTAFHSTMERSLTGQLAEIGLASRDIEYLSLSHSHPDHSGNANLFANSIWIANRAERNFMFTEGTAEARAGYSKLEDSETVLFDDAHDVFGDGSVVIYHTPGHTPGHSVLLLKLAKAGALLFSGDLHIVQEGYDMRAIPRFNTDAEQTVASMARFEALVKEHNARAVIEHDKSHFEALPAFPKFLD